MIWHFNLKTARMLGLTMPTEIIVTATEVFGIGQPQNALPSRVAR